jgi:hypothetical protein
MVAQLLVRLHLDYVSNGQATLHGIRDIHLHQRIVACFVRRSPHLNASAIIADDAGIHWKTIGESTMLVRYVADQSLHSQGTFLFAATAMLGPFIRARIIPALASSSHWVLKARASCSRYWDRRMAISMRLLPS